MHAESRKTQIERKRAELGEFRTEKIEVPVRLLMTTIVHEPVRADLRRRQLVGGVNRRLGPAELKCRQPAHMPHDDHTVLVDHDRLLPPVLLQRRRDLVDRSLRDLARVFCVRQDFAQRADLDLHEADS